MMSVEEALDLTIEARESGDYMYEMNSPEYLDTVTEALRKQIPKNPVFRKVFTNLPGEVYAEYEACPACNGVLQQWNFYRGICSCGQKIKREGMIL